MRERSPAGRPEVAQEVPVGGPVLVCRSRGGDGLAQHRRRAGAVLEDEVLVVVSVEEPMVVI